MLVCTNINGVLYLQADFSIHCTDDTWHKFIPAVIFFIIVYPVSNCSVFVSACPALIS